MRTRPETMIFHGAVVILLGLLAGFPYALVVTGTLASSERAWRMAHLEGVLNGLVVIVVAAVWDRLALEGRKRDVLVWALVLMAYGNVVASAIGATFGVRGLAPGDSFSNTLVYLLFMAAVVGVVVGLALVAEGAWKRRRAGAS
jgi:CDP-diglyceride synthetase